MTFARASGQLDEVSGQRGQLFNEVVDARLACATDWEGRLGCDTGRLLAKRRFSHPSDGGVKVVDGLGEPFSARSIHHLRARGQGEPDGEELLDQGVGRLDRHLAGSPDRYLRFGLGLGRCARRYLAGSAARAADRSVTALASARFTATPWIAGHR